MTPNEYQKLAARTCPKVDMREMLTLGALGLAGESGEAVEHVKKFLFHDKGLNFVEFEKELGDVAWYLATLCTAVGCNFEDVLQANIDKLKARWPDGFKTGEG